MDSVSNNYLVFLCGSSITPNISLPRPLTIGLFKGETMPNFTLHLSKLIQPNFGSNNSRKNFRLAFDITYFTNDDKIANSLVIMPAEKAWQWSDPKETKYLQVNDPNADPVELNLSVIDQNKNGFAETDKEVLVFQGKKVHSIKVKIFDVKDKSFADGLIWVAKNVLPTVVSGGLGSITGAIGSKFVVSLITELNDKNELSSALVAEMTKRYGEKAGEKVLFNGGKLTVAEGPNSIKGTGKWKNSSKDGVYEIVLNLEKFTI